MRRLVSRTVRIDAAVDLVSVLRSVPGFVWIREGDGFIAWGEAARIDPGTGSDRFVRAASMTEELLSRAVVSDEVRLPGSGPVAFASFSFDPMTDGSRIVVPAAMIWRSGDDAWITMTGTPSALEDAISPAAEHSAAWGALGEQAWIRAVARVRDQIRGGWLSKVVLAREVSSAGSFDVRAIVRALGERFPSCYTFAFDGLVGASPELLVRRIGSRVESLVLAGTARRGRDSNEDEELGRALFASSKERSEHSLAVDTVRDVLSLVCADLKLEEDPSLLRLANVQHLATHVLGELADRLTALELAGQLHPTAAVCGVPASDAMALIRSLEGFDRGRYAGPIGWVDASGDGEFAIALRCAEISGDVARLFAGNGIVADSDPEAELAETNMKLDAMRRAMGLS